MRVAFDTLPDLDDAAECVRAFREIFPAPGCYRIEPDDELVAKAVGDEGEGPFETWFLQELERRANLHFETAELTIWETLDGLLARHRVTAPSELAEWELHRTLFDLSVGSTAEMCGIRIPADVEARLLALGWRPLEVLDFPALAYRIGRIQAALTEPALTAVTTWPRVLELAHSHPLTAAEEAGIAFARRRGAVWLTPILDDTGRAWTADREINPVRRLTARVIEDREHLGMAMTRLRNSQRAQGIVRDARRVVRTEIAEARSRGAWAAQKPLDDDVRMIRMPSSNPCRACAELYLNPDGTPRPYRRSDLERMSQTPNRGPRAEWTAKIGPTHPNCVCSPWREYLDALRPLYESHAAENRAILEHVGAYKEVA